MDSRFNHHLLFLVHSLLPTSPDHHAADFPPPISLHDRLLFAVPKKGRLQQATLDLLAGSDIKFHRHNRLDLALVMNLPLALVFLPAADIPEFVAEGRVDLGITGRDTVAEYQASNNANNNTSDTTIGIDEIMDLEFGRCKLQVQVPKGSIRDPKELVGKRIATSFTGLAEAYFRQLEAEVEESLPNVLTNGASSGELPKKKLLTNIRPLSGSVEAACALGLADGIVDLVGTQTPFFPPVSPIYRSIP